MTPRRRAVFLCCDGLGRDWVRANLTPTLARLRSKGLWCADHRAVFPSVTRVSAASVATGSTPARHGLHGNRMGLIEGRRIVVRDVGKPDFREHMRRATGRTLLVPTLAERVAASGGFIAFSNVSPGAAYFLDPEHFGRVYHRAGSFAPGGAPIEGPDALSVSHDLAGDWIMTQRFCSEVLTDRRPAIAVLWLANPDLTLHGHPLGSSAHLAALAGTDRCVLEVLQTLEGLRADGEEILLLIGSDHGQETTGDCIDLGAWLSAQGLASHLAEGDIAVAGQGTAALLYGTSHGRDALMRSLDNLRAEAWVDEVVVADALAARGHVAVGGLLAAVNMGQRNETNAHGVLGWRWTVAEADKQPAIGCGQHGGWGPDETRPFLIMNAPGLGATAIGRPTSLIDIAPTLLSYLGLPAGDQEGSPILAGAARPRLQ